MFLCFRNRAGRGRVESGGREWAGRGSDGTIRLSAEAARLPGQFRQPASVSLSLSSHAVSEATDPPGRGAGQGIASASVPLSVSRGGSGGKEERRVDELVRSINDTKQKGRRVKRGPKYMYFD